MRQNISSFNEILFPNNNLNHYKHSSAIKGTLKR